MTLPYAKDSTGEDDRGHRCNVTVLSELGNIVFERDSLNGMDVVKYCVEFTLNDNNSSELMLVLLELIVNMILDGWVGWNPQLLSRDNFKCHVFCVLDVMFHCSLAVDTCDDVNDVIDILFLLPDPVTAVLESEFCDKNLTVCSLGCVVEMIRRVQSANQNEDMI